MDLCEGIKGENPVTDTEEEGERGGPEERLDELEGGVMRVAEGRLCLRNFPIWMKLISILSVLRAISATTSMESW